MGVLFVVPSSSSSSRYTGLAHNDAQRVVIPAFSFFGFSKLAFNRNQYPGSAYRPDSSHSTIRSIFPEFPAPWATRWSKISTCVLPKEGWFARPLRSRNFHNWIQHHAPGTGIPNRQKRRTPYIWCHRYMCILSRPALRYPVN